MDVFLVVDDNQSVSEYLAAMLVEEIGVRQAYIAHSANDALALLDQNPQIHVVLCDLYMDQVDGLEMIRLLKERQFRGYFGIISSMAAKVIHSAEQLAKIHQINLLGSIPKPISQSSVEELLSRVGGKPKDKPHSSPETPLKIYELIRGIEKHQFEVFYQPQVDIISRRVIGVEALTRLKHPRHGLIYPNRFIPAMEKTSLISDLTLFVLDHAMRDWQHWANDGVSLQVSVNISPVELNNLDFPEYVLQRLKQFSMPAEQLTLEVTESAIEADASHTLEILNRLSMHGIQLSIDDFGTGHSSIERLRKYPFDELKIDKDFMANAQRSQSERTLVESSVGLAKRLGMKVVFEGIESADLYQMSDHLGGDIIQGFYISRALRADDLLGWIDNWRASNR